MQYQAKAKLGRFDDYHSIQELMLKFPIHLTEQSQLQKLKKYFYRY
jgi:hypothetical protein